MPGFLISNINIVLLIFLVLFSLRSARHKAPGLQAGEKRSVGESSRFLNRQLPGESLEKGAASTLCAGPGVPMAPDDKQSTEHVGKASRVRILTLAQP